MRKFMHIVVMLAVAISVMPLTSVAQQSDSAAAKTGQSATTLSGYPANDSLEGPGGVTDELAQDNVNVGAMLTFPTIQNFFKPWFDWKKRLNENHGLKIGFSYAGLYQESSETLTGIDEAAAGRAQFQGSWTLIGRNTKNPGLVSFRVESRNAYGSKIPPTQLGAQFGSAAPTGSGFSDFGTALTELAWRQGLMDGKLKFIFGKISATSWYNTVALSSAMTGFQDLALRTSLTKPGPGRGIGGGGAGLFGKQSRWVALAGIHDANAVTSGNPFDTIDEREFYYSTELRWFPNGFKNRKFDQIRIQAWYQDERTDAGIPSDHGITFAASRLYDNLWMPFVLGGLSDGDASTFKTDLIAGVGFGFKPVHRTARDVLGFALGWGKPADSTLHDQYTSELFYRFMLVPNLAITPSVQYIDNPTNNPDDTDAWVVGLRGRLTF